MGHLINPIAFRVGWSREWVDDFYMDARFYPEMLHRLLRFRYFLNCFFSFSSYETNYFDEHLISHFNFTLDLEGFTLSVYFYNTRLETTWYEFSDRISERPFAIRFFPKKREDPPIFSSFNRRYFSLIFILYYYSVNGVLDEPYKFRVHFFKAFENYLHPLEFSSAYKQTRGLGLSNLSPSEKECFILLYSIRFSILQEVGRLRQSFRGFGLRLTNYELLAQKFFHLIYMHQITKPFLRSFYFYLKFFGNCFFLHQPLEVIFFQITNDQLSARFLAKFLAVRFSQGVTVRSTINPIRRDLRLAKKFARRWHAKARMGASQKLHSRDSHITLLLNLVGYAVRYHSRNSRDLWSFDQFFLAFQRVKQDYTRVYQFMRAFFERRLIFNLVVRFSSDVKKLFFFAKYSYAFLLELFSVYHLNYESSRIGYSYDSVFSLRRLGSASLIFLTGAALLDFLKFSSRHPSNVRKLDTEFPANRRVFRSFVPPALGLFGFRIRLHGRFTRKQIASSYHYQEGCLPLSTFKAHIDYGFATVPIRNSAVGIKVWLYRQGTVADFDFAYSF